MDKNTALIGLLILIGLGLALPAVFIIDGKTGRTEDLWFVQNPLAVSTSGSAPEKGTNLISGTVPGNDTSPLPVETTNFSNDFSVRTAKMLAYNQSAVLLSFPGGKLGFLEITDNDVEFKAKILSAEQKKLAEKIALADARVRDIIRASMYNVDIQPLARITRTDSAEIPANGMAASVTITIVNTTTARNETTFFVHVDLVNEKVIRISPLFPYTQTTAVT